MPKDKKELGAHVIEEGDAEVSEVMLTFPITLKGVDVQCIAISEGINPTRAAYILALSALLTNNAKAEDRLFKFIDELVADFDTSFTFAATKH